MAERQYQAALFRYYDPSTSLSPDPPTMENALSFNGLFVSHLEQLSRIIAQPQVNPLDGYCLTLADVIAVARYVSMQPVLEPHTEEEGTVLWRRSLNMRLQE